MKAWFFALQPRERWILTAGAVVALAIVAWGLVLKPLRAQSAVVAASVESKRRLLVDLARLDGLQGGATSARAIQDADKTLVVIITNTAQAYGLTFPRARPNGPSGIDVTFQGAPFDVLTEWLVALHDNYAIDVESASLSSGREQGLVNGQLSLHRL